MRALLAALLLLAPALDAQAQHPCDATWPTSQTITPLAAYRLQVCAPQTPTEAALVINGTARPREPLTRTQGPNASGFSLFDGTTNVTLAVGAYSLQAIMYLGGIETSRTPVLSVQAATTVAPPPPPPPPTPPLPTPTCPTRPGEVVSGSVRAVKETVTSATLAQRTAELTSAGWTVIGFTGTATVLAVCR